MLSWNRRAKDANDDDDINIYEEAKLELLLCPVNVSERLSAYSNESDMHCFTSNPGNPLPTGEFPLSPVRLSCEL